MIRDYVTDVTGALIPMSEEAREKLEAERAEEEAGRSGQNRGRRTSFSARELLIESFPDLRFAVDGLIPEGLTFICGAPKLGKSWLALDLCVAVASGGRAFGALRVARGEVLYLALEDSPRRLQSRLRTLLRSDNAPDGLHLETAWPRLDEGGADRLDVFLDAHPNTRLVVIDVWPRIRPRLGARTAKALFDADYNAASPLQTMAIDRGIPIVVLFHTRKAEGSDFVENVTGTFGTAAAADTILVLKRSRGQADATLSVTGRDIEERELALRFAPEAGTWAMLGDAAEYAFGDTSRVILEAVRKHGALSPMRASDVTEIGYELAKKTMARMARRGQLVRNRGRYDLPSSVPAVPLSLDAE